MGVGCGDGRGDLRESAVSSDRIIADLAIDLSGQKGQSREATSAEVQAVEFKGAEYLSYAEFAENLWK